MATLEGVMLLPSLRRSEPKDMTVPHERPQAIRVSSSNLVIWFSSV